ncbi:MAG: dihydroorotate dehydrogenase-like protein [Bacteroidales bacterium]|nr:dihydroorotate dehydrogenase-like protein [Bacteroidales bacterium]MDD4217069.1 dihydroorotate dehydrogenase-like protein [Bacteroidales bacterium]MDY0142490.1 dihydroorotate dehydrogenase-like protein [Bacteroidales bacterium]
MNVDLSTSYMGLQLKNPVIIGASRLTGNVESILNLEKNGAAAVVLKSLFEEQILMDIDNQRMNNIFDSYSDVENYIGFYTKQNSLNNYLKLIKDAKTQTKIPVIASINCDSNGEWIEFAKKIENAGADALELNIFILPSDPEKTGEEIEQTYFDIIKSVKSVVNIPIAVKMSYYFSGFANFATRLSNTGINAMVFFNRFFSPDINIKTQKVGSGNLYSTPEENSMVLRWTGILANKLECDLAASTGIHDGKAVIKNLMAGANAVQMVSGLYLNGVGDLVIVLQEIEKILSENNFTSIKEIIGIANKEKITNPQAYQRAQFMKYFSDSGK